jgi:hypothetical protein
VSGVANAAAGVVSNVGAGAGTLLGG